MIARSTWGRVVTWLAVTALLTGAFALAGCGGTKESPGGPSGTGIEEGVQLDEAVQAQVLKAMDDAGLKYTKDYVGMEQTGENTVIVRGGTIKQGDKTMDEVTMVKDSSGKWAVKSE